jgi:hypothetical protein
MKKSFSGLKSCLNNYLNLIKGQNARVDHDVILECMKAALLYWYRGGELGERSSKDTLPDGTIIAQALGGQFLLILY